jgi:hypothetical protein
MNRADRWALFVHIVKRYGPGFAVALAMWAIAILIIVLTIRGSG